MAQLAYALSLCVMPALLAVAVTDVRLRRVPGCLVGVVAATGLASRAAAGGLPATLLLSLGAAALVFAGCVLLWLFGLLGGGDVKLLPACALAVPAGAVVALLLAVSLAGGVLAAIYLALRAAVPPTAPLPPKPSGRSPLRRLLRVEGWRVRRRAHLPYACAISAGCAFTILAG